MTNEEYRCLYDKALHEEALRTEYEKQRPSVLFRPTLILDGNQYCALYGTDIVSGVAGFGDTAGDAMYDFDKQWATTKAPQMARTNGGGAA